MSRQLEVEWPATAEAWPTWVRALMCSVFLSCNSFFGFTNVWESTTNPANCLCRQASISASGWNDLCKERRVFLVYRFPTGQDNSNLSYQIILSFWSSWFAWVRDEEKLLHLYSMDNIMPDVLANSFTCHFEEELVPKRGWHALSPYLTVKTQLLDF